MKLSRLSFLKKSCLALLAAPFVGLAANPLVASPEPAAKKFTGRNCYRFNPTRESASLTKKVDFSELRKGDLFVLEDVEDGVVEYAQLARAVSDPYYNGTFWPDGRPMLGISAENCHALVDNRRS